MSQSMNLSNGKWQTVADLENAAINLEKDLDVNKSFVRKVLIGLSNLMTAIKHLEAGIFNQVLKWFRLYLNVHSSINPDDKKLMKFFENTIPTILTYIIGCLQYKTKEIPNYHYKLLDILEQLLENTPTNVLAKIKNFEIGTIGCLWNPIDIVGDFNTQLKALKILSTLLKQFDETRQNEELKDIKWTNLNLFQDKLKTIVQETKLSQHLENASRELLNNFNMNLSKSVLVYSFYCKSLELGNRYVFYKPLNLQHFWIDVNYTPKTLTYVGRFKLNSKSRYENISAVLKIQTMKLENDILYITFKENGEFSKYSEHLTSLPENVVKFNLPKEEVKRLKENEYIMEYFNKLNNCQIKNDIRNQTLDNVFDLLRDENSQAQRVEKSLTTSNRKSNTNSKNDNKSESTNNNKSIDQKSDSNAHHKYYKFLLDTPPNQNLHSNANGCLKTKYSTILPDSPKSSKKANNTANEEHPIRKLRERKKFFTTLLDENSEPEMVKGKTQKKKSQCRKPRQSKPRGKQVQKVTPLAEVTNLKQNQNEIKPVVTSALNNLKVSLPKWSSPLITTQDCNKILKNVADIYNVGDTTYAKPCQSYKEFKTDFIANSNLNKSNIPSKRAQNKKRDNAKEKLSLITKKSQNILNKNNEGNKENVSPTKINTLQKIKRSISTDIFESQHQEVISPNKIVGKPNIENKKMSIDLTFDEENISNTSFECEEVRGNYETFLKNTTPISTPPLINDNSKLCTPRPTSSMNISDINDSDMELTQIPFNCKFTTNENEHNKTINCETLEKNFQHPNVVNQIIQDFGCDSKVYNSEYRSPLKENSIVMQTSSNTDEFCSSSGNKKIEYNESNNLTSLLRHAETIEMPINRDFIVMHSRPIYYCQQKNAGQATDENDMITISTAAKTNAKCQITPTAVIMHQIQVSTKKSLIFRNNKPKKFYTRFKAKKNLNSLYSENQPEYKEQSINLNQDKLMLANVNLDTVPLTTNKDRNNNIIFTPFFTLHKRNNFKNHQSFENTPTLALTHINPTAMQNYIMDFTGDNSSQNRSSVNETSSAADTTDILYNKEFENGSLNVCDFNESSASTSAVDEVLMKDLQEVLNNHNKNIQLYVENNHHRFQSNISDIYSNKFTELIKALLQKSERQKCELERLLSNIGHLVKEIQTEYETFMKRTKEYDINRDVMLHILEHFSNIQNSRTKEYESLVKELNIESSELLQKLLKIYLEK